MKKRNDRTHAVRGAAYEKLNVRGRGAPSIECAQERSLDRDPLLSRITLDPKIMVGQPVVRGTRLTVSFILGRLAHGSPVEELLSEYGGLTREDVQACLLWRTPL